MDKNKITVINEFYEEFCFESMKQLKRINDGIMSKDSVTYDDMIHLKENMSMVIRLNGEV